jgi:predicted nuclease of restriction endonuclease-like (RecB) superfamily
MKEYHQILESLKNEIRSARLRAVMSANAEMLRLYWQIGNTILQQQSEQGWGAKIIDRLSTDLKSEFPDMTGLSVRNLKYMRAFAESYPDAEFVQASLAQITWYHHITLLDKVKDKNQRLLYIEETAKNGWSRDVMVHQIESKYLQRKGISQSNFQAVLPQPFSDLAQQTFKDPYLFDFITLADGYREKELEDALTENITKFLLELGLGFAYVGRQYPIEVSEREFAIDLLFYHLKLRSYIVIDLKIVDFQPEFVGKLNFYLSAVDDKLKTEHDQPSIGLLICKNKDKLMVEYALRDVNKPIGISEYLLTEALPENIKSSLPTIQEIEEKLIQKKSKNL